MFFYRFILKLVLLESLISLPMFFIIKNSMYFLIQKIYFIHLFKNLTFFLSYSFLDSNLESNFYNQLFKIL